MTITHALILMVEKIALGSPFARIVTKARATELLMEGQTLVLPLPT